MGGGSQKTDSNSKSVATPPQWWEDAAIKSLQVADRINQAGYVPYMGNQIAAFTPMQTRAMQSASDWMTDMNGGKRKDAMAGMPEAKRDASGVKGYSSAEGFMNNLELMRKRFPAQYDILRQFGGDLLANPSQAPADVTNSPWNVGATAAASKAAGSGAGGGGSGGIGDIMPFGLQRPPGMMGHHGGMSDPGFADVFYSMGIPGTYTKGPGGFAERNIYEDQYLAAIRAGRDPSTVMPWGQKPTGPAPTPTPPKPPAKPNYKNPKKWW